MQTRSQFVTRLQSRRSAGESLASIARSFGVSAVTVKLWLDGKRNPSKTVLILAELLWGGAGKSWQRGNSGTCPDSPPAVAMTLHIFFAASRRISRSRSPTMRSSPGKRLYEAKSRASRLALTSIEGSPSLNCRAQS